MNNSPMRLPNGLGLVRSLVKHVYEDAPVLGKWVITPAAVLGLVWLLYVWEWGTLTAFVGAIDHNDLLFQDFLYYYYQMASRMPEADGPVTGYLYSSFFAVVIAPLGRLQPQDALWVWGIFQGIMLLALLYVPLIQMLKRSPIEIMLYIGVLATSFPILHNATWGQVGVLITLCVVLSFHAYVSNWRALAGALLALAITIKYYPAVFLAYFVLKRDWRFLVGAAIGLILFYFLVPALMMGPQSWLKFEIATNEARSKMAWVTSDVNSQYFVHVVFRWVGDLLSASGESFVSVLQWIGYGVVLANLNLLRMVRGDGMQDKDVMAMVILFLSLPFLVKTSWPHYLTYLPVCQLFLLAQAISREEMSRRVRGSVIAVTVASIISSSFFGFLLFPSWDVFTGYGMLFIANGLSLIGAYLLVSSAQVAIPRTVP